MTIKTRTKFDIVYPGDNEPFTRIQGLNPSSTCIPLQGERRHDDERRHLDLYSRVNPVIYSDLVGLKTQLEIPIDKNLLSTINKNAY